MKPTTKLLLFCLGLFVCLPALALYAPLRRAVAAQMGLAAATQKQSPDTASSRRTTVSRATQTTEDSLWQPLAAPTVEAVTEQTQRTASQRLMQLNQEALQRLLASAPQEFSERSRQAPLVLTLPLPDGTLARFKVVESTIMTSDLAARLPQIKTYQGQGLDDPALTARFDWSPQGLHGIILSGSEAFFIEPQTAGNTSRYLTYDASSVEQERGRVACGVRETATALKKQATVEFAGRATPEVTAGAQLRTYRTAITTTGEWTQVYGQGNVNTAATAIVTIMNQINAIFEREIAVRFVVINNQGLIYTDAATDPFANVSSGEELEKTQQTLDQAIGNANYDIGHLFGTTQGFSGLAGLGVVCNAPRKGQGLSLMGGQLTHPINVLGLAHEIGHQFNANHSYNGTTDGCNSRSDQASWEPGSGSTIMSYVGSCGAENLQQSTDPFFHIGSLEAMSAFITNNTCANLVATGNNPPTVNAGANYTIPKETPFTLTATGNDPDGDAVTYSWEQLDLGAAGPPNTDDGQTRPLFRSFAPTANPARTLPQMQYVLAGNLPLTYQANGRTFLVGESYATTTRTMNFRVTARDNRANGGGVNSGAMQINVRSEAGPLVVTAPAADVRLAPGSAQTVTWNVANTNAAPINTENVRLTLSTDGGVTFPTVLAESVPNNGQAQITLPTVAPTATARIKVEAVGNVFFNVSPGFAIGGACATFTLGPATLPDAPVFMEYEAQTLTTEGGVAPYKYKVTAGALPRGILLSEAGQLTGVPQDAGTFTFTITASDAAQCSGTKAYVLKVLPEATIADTGVTAPPPGLNGARNAVSETAGKPVEFFVTLSAPSNEPVSIFYATEDGSAKAGVNYQANSGSLIFAPGETQKRVNVLVFGATSGGSSTQAFFMNLSEPVNTLLSDKHGACAIIKENNDNCPTIVFNTPSLLDARVHENYDMKIQASGSEGIRFNLAGGCLPAGLSMDANGRITGQPIQAGNFNFRLAAIDKEGCFAVREFALKIGEPSACIVGFSPTAGQVGDKVTLLGVRFTNVREVSFGNRPAQFAVKSENEIVATVPSGATTNLLRVTTNNGTANSLQPFTLLNTAPVATSQQYTTLRNHPLSKRLRGNDADGNQLRFEIVRLEASTRGTVILTNASTGAFTYTPPLGYVGEDAFFYRIFDGALASGLGKITVKVIGAPRITKVGVQGFGAQRQLIVIGEYFDPDAIVLVNGQKLATRNDRFTPDTRLVAFLEAGLIKPGMVTIQVRNPDGSRSAEFPFKLPRR
ncbi:MAG: putative Ig domain-containing protein [Acidobacteria bacterium]|nr:putative Ig domain-containing protein [Acidobacteriota bacterium]